MNRRDFGRLCLGGFGLTGLISLLKPDRVLVHGAEPIKPLEAYTTNLKGVPGSIIYDTVTVNSDGSTKSITYTFLKGPNFTNLEDVHEEILRQIDEHNQDLSIKDIVYLQSISYKSEQKT